MAGEFGIAGVQTVFEGVEVNTPDRLRHDQTKYGLRIPFGHDAISPDGRYPTTMVNYRTGGTPWLVVIDPAGTVIENGFSIDAEELRSEEHTSELQSLMRISYAVFCLKKKK